MDASIEPTGSRLRRKSAAMSGQTLVFVPLVLLLITVFFCITYDVAWYCRQRIALQEAADSAALGAARVQGMMLESIAAGNDAIAYNVGQILTDIPKVFDPATTEAAIEDIIKRIEWIEKIQQVQGGLASVAGGVTLVEAATETNASAAGADAFAWPPSNNNIIGIELPGVTGSHPELLLESPAVWTAWLFTMPETKDGVPTSFPLEEKPVVVAFSNEEGKMPLPIPTFGNRYSQLCATSASAPYFIPLGGNPMDRASMEDTNFWRGLLCLMIPGPFWGARLDEVGPLTAESTGEGMAVWAGKKAVTYGLDKLLDYIKDKLKADAIERLTGDVAEMNETEMETFGENE